MFLGPAAPLSKHESQQPGSFSRTRPELQVKAVELVCCLESRKERDEREKRDGCGDTAPDSGHADILPVSGGRQISQQDEGGVEIY
jgi:hypothetical protein